MKDSALFRILLAWAILWLCTFFATYPRHIDMSALKTENAELKIANEQCRNQFDALLKYIGDDLP